MIVIMREPVEYLAKVLFDGGQIEEMTIQGSPLTASCYNSKMDLLLADGRVFTLNWSKVISIDFKPVKWDDIERDFPGDAAAQMVGRGAARWPGQKELLVP